MQLRHLRSFVAVASTLSFTRAARQVHLAQSSVTEQVQALETDLGTPLFDRSRRKLRLTQAGYRLVDYAEKMLALDREARLAVAEASLDGGALSLGALETLSAQWVAGPLERLRQARPGLTLRLDVAGTGELLARVRHGDLDACLVFSAPSEPALDHAIVGSSELVAIAHARHAWSKGGAVRPSDLLEQRLLVTSKGCVYRRLFDDAMSAMSDGSYQIAGELDSLAAICALVAQGSGCALMPRLAVPVSDNRIVARPWHGPTRVASIYLVWRRQTTQSPALMAFLELLTGKRQLHEAMTAVDV